jgi:hypothetical protein
MRGLGLATTSQRRPPEGGRYNVNRKELKGRRHYESPASASRRRGYLQDYFNTIASELLRASIGRISRDA